MHRDIVISPSGNFYGSEQVLFDYLRSSKKKYTVHVPEHSLFSRILNQSNLNHTINMYESSRLKVFYFGIFLNILFVKTSAVYLNEAGHARYIVMLARFFKKRMFIIHLRIAEDTITNRWPAVLPNNIKVIAISKYMQGLFKLNSTLLYDPYIFTKETNSIVSPKENSIINVINIGVIGRISKNKGIDALLELLKLIQSQNITDIKFHLFGEPDSEALNNGQYDQLSNMDHTRVHGFVDDKDKIYNAIDCVIHFAEREPLGRIFLEAINYSKPLIGINSGGIGEIGNLTGLNELLIDEQSAFKSNDFLKMIQMVKSSPINYIQKCKDGKVLATQLFSIDYYSKAVDELLS